MSSGSPDATADATPVAYLSRKEAALALGFTRQRLEKLIKQGRISETPAGIDIAAARASLDARRDIAKRAAYEASVALKSKPGHEAVTVRPLPEPASRPSAPTAAPDASDADAGPPADLFDFNSARAKRETHNAALAELKYRREQGLLISREEVVAREFAVARKLRDRILAWPARLANFVPPEAMRTIVEECDQLIRELQEDAAGIAEASVVHG